MKSYTGTDAVVNWKGDLGCPIVPLVEFLRHLESRRLLGGRDWKINVLELPGDCLGAFLWSVNTVQFWADKPILSHSLLDALRIEDLGVNGKLRRLNLCMSCSRTAIMIALTVEPTNSVKLLLQQDMNLSCRDIYGFTAEEYASFNGFTM